MTQEDKELLLKDLCARLPYGVKVCIKLPNHQEHIFEEQVGELKELTSYGGYLVKSKGIDYRSFNLDIKPYLRPLSSMTEEEIEEYKKCVNSFEYWKNTYVLRPRTCNDWQEIVKAMSAYFDCPLQQALTMYKEDRNKYIKWYNDHLETALLLGHVDSIIYGLGKQVTKHGELPETNPHYIVE